MNVAKIGALLEDSLITQEKNASLVFVPLSSLTIHHWIITYSVCNFYSQNGLVGGLQAFSGPNFDDYFMRTLKSTKYWEDGCSSE